MYISRTTLSLRLNFSLDRNAPGLIQQTGIEERKRSNVYDCSDNVVDLQQHSRIGSGPQCPDPLSVSGKCRGQH